MFNCLMKQVILVQLTENCRYLDKKGKSVNTLPLNRFFKTLFYLFRMKNFRFIFYL